MFFKVSVCRCFNMECIDNSNQNTFMENYTKAILCIRQRKSNLISLISAPIFVIFWNYFSFLNQNIIMEDNTKTDICVCQRKSNCYIFAIISFSKLVIFPGTIFLLCSINHLRHLWLETSGYYYTRQNKLRVQPRPKQCISISSDTPALIQTSEC